MSMGAASAWLEIILDLDTHTLYDECIFDLATMLQEHAPVE